MQKAPFIEMSGAITIEVDPVDVEQAIIERPKAVEGFPPSMQAMVAALNLPDTVSFSRQIEKHGYCLCYTLCIPMPQGKTHVVFNIVKRRLGLIDG